jgi:two-component system cell cycle response regulator
MMPIRIRSHPILTLAVSVMCLGVGFEALHAVFDLGGSGLNSFSNDGVYTAVEFIAVGVCGARAVKRRDDRLAWTLMTLGLAAWTAGDLIWTIWLDGLARPPFPSPADAAYLIMYPAVYAALMLLIRSRLRHAGIAQWLDGGVVGLAIAAGAAAIVFSAVLASTTGRFVPDAVTLSYPVGDLALLIFVAVACSLSGWRPGREWLLLGAAVSVTAAADIIFVYEVAGGSYHSGTLLDVLWPTSMAMFALAAWVPARPRTVSRSAPHTILLTLLAAAGALALLVIAAFTRVTAPAVGLAAAALILAAVRAALTYAENVSMLRSSAHDALTDVLSGLGNRRALMDDLERAFAERSDAHTLVFFDLNGFKRYNDSFGHAAGDALLARLGASLKASVASAGRAYRLGGDEFCVLLEGRFKAGDRLVATAASALVQRGSVFTIGVSLGTAVVPDDALTASAALQLADERMYAEKAGSSRASRAQARDVLMALLSERTPNLSMHVSGVADLVSRVAGKFSLDSEELDELLRAAELHDIGKLAIPDAILDKPGPLDAEEWQFMRQHPVIGERILSAAPALVPVAKLVRASHERWDGTGYPDGLKETEIPVGARILSACDAFEAMTAERCYQRPRSQADAAAELRRHGGTQFDPEVVEALCRCLPAAESGPDVESLPGRPAAA